MYRYQCDFWSNSISCAVACMIINILVNWLAHCVDHKSVVKGKKVIAGVDIGGRRMIKKNVGVVVDAHLVLSRVHTNTTSKET